ncbi:hypothetical protein TUMSATVNIG2_33550 [Vibrio nigripulchritudo]|nr:hypothetical protein TUMSATVNIG2_33550 [Vibrio nigripulchritudo]
MLVCFVLGSIFTLNYHAPILEQISLGLSGRRVEFDYRNAQHGALIIGASILISLLFLSRLIKDSQKNIATLLTCLLVMAFLIIIQIVLQTRQAILGITAAIICTSLYGYYIKDKLNIKSIMFILAITIIVILIGRNSDIIYQRLSSELYVITDYILIGDFSNIPYTSVGIRVQLWLESAMWIIKSPLLGFGNGAEAFIIEQSSRLPQRIAIEFKHVHNSYIATLLRFGLLGLLLGFAILIFPIIDLFKSTKGKENIQYIKYLAIMFLVYWLVVNTFESFWYMKAGLWTYTVLMAAIYTIPLSQRYEKYQASLKS